MAELEEEIEENLVEEREKLTISPSGADPTVRKAYFIKPSVSSIKAPVSELSFGHANSSLPSSRAYLKLYKNP